MPECVEFSFLLNLTFDFCLRENLQFPLSKVTCFLLSLLCMFKNNIGDFSRDPQLLTTQRHTRNTSQVSQRKRRLFHCALQYLFIYFFPHCNLTDICKYLFCRQRSCHAALLSFTGRQSSMLTTRWHLDPYFFAEVKCSWQRVARHPINLVNSSKSTLLSWFMSSSLKRPSTPSLLQAFCW